MWGLRQVTLELAKNPHFRFKLLSKIDAFPPLRFVSKRAILQLLSSASARWREQAIESYRARALSMVFGVLVQAGVAFLSSKHAPPQ